MAKINIIVVDDHKMFLEGLKDALSKKDNLQIVGTYTNGNEMLNVLKNEIIDLLITDISMPKINGVELIKNAKEIQPSLKILVVSMFKQIQSLNSINGYLLKETSYDELITAIESIVLNNTSYFYKDFQRKHNFLEFNKTILTTREKQIIKLIANEYSVNEIAKTPLLSPHTIETHKKNIFHKLQVTNTAGLMKKAFYLGYIE